MTIGSPATRSPVWRRLRTALAWGFAVLAVGAAGLVARTVGGPGAFLRIDETVAGPAAGLSSVGSILPFGYAFAAGMLASVNPCGFALLPGYLGLYLSSKEAAEAPAPRLARALAVAATMSGAFVLTFGVAGVLLTAAGSVLTSALPVMGLLVGLVLAGAGAFLLSGHKLYTSLADRAATQLSGAARAPGYRGFAAYGFAYAAASLGCALPIFLTVLALAAAGRDPARSAVQFVLYGLGMGLVVTVLTLATALFKVALVARIRLASGGFFGGRILEGATGVLLVLTGAYVTAYWLALGF